jgi:hypothetical protein
MKIRSKVNKKGVNKIAIKQLYCASSPDTPPYFQLFRIRKLKVFNYRYKSILPDNEEKRLEFSFEINKSKVEYLPNDIFFVNQNVSRQYQDPCFYARKKSLHLSCGRFF